MTYGRWQMSTGARRSIRASRALLIPKPPLRTQDASIEAGPISPGGRVELITGGLSPGADQQQRTVAQRCQRRLRIGQNTGSSRAREYW
jgi:hypothetical protein